MKTFDTSWKLFTVVLASVVGLPAYAQTDALMQAIDRNRDGSLQQGEIDLAVAALRGLDRNKDGTVGADELVPPAERKDTARSDRQPQGREGVMRRPGQPGQGGDRGAHFFAQMDKDKDGKISKEEAPERLKERFDSVDTNRDGILDKSELEVLAKRMRDRSQQSDQKRRSNMYQKDGKTSGGATPKRPAPIE